MIAPGTILWQPLACAAAPWPLVVVVWYDWVSGSALTAIVGAALIQLLVFGLPLSLVMIDMVQLDVLLGTATGGTPSIAGTMTDLIVKQLQVGVMAGLAIAILMLPLFLVYAWIRGARRQAAQTSTLPAR
jgi:hypothetical protein